MYTWQSFCLTILLLILLFFISKFIEFFYHKKLYNLISWIGSMKLEQSVLYVQKDLGFSDEFCLSQEDLRFASVILSKFRQDTVTKYFKDYRSFYIPKGRNTIDGEIYFLYLLHSYLDEHQCDYDFSGHEMLGQIISRKEYDGDGWEATYKLTDFGFVFHKLLYLAYMYCKKNKAINSQGKYYNNEFALADIITSKTISISHYRA